MLAMQKADPKNKDCWTSCGIIFNEIQPEFTWGSDEDISWEDYDLHCGA